MSTWLLLAAVAFRATTLLLLLGFGVWEYRRLRLRSLPWLGAYTALILPLDVVTPRLLGAVVNNGALPGGLAPGEFLSWYVYTNRVLGALAALLVAVLVVAEVAGLLARAGVGPEGWARRLLGAVRERVALLGVLLLGVTLASPLAVALFWIAAGRAG